MHNDIQNTSIADQLGLDLLQTFRNAEVRIKELLDVLKLLLGELVLFACVVVIHSVENRLIVGLSLSYFNKR